MPHLRRRLSWILSGWLLMQLVGIVAPVALAAAGIDLEETCTCPGVEHGATCPMHHPATRTKTDDSTRCTLRSATAPVDAALLSLGVVGVVPSIASVSVEIRPTPVVTIVRSLIGRSELPDSPPPRT